MKLVAWFGAGVLGIGGALFWMGLARAIWQETRPKSLLQAVEEARKRAIHGHDGLGHKVIMYPDGSLYADQGLFVEPYADFINHKREASNGRA